jgi:predicted glycosyltransferase
VSLFPQGARLLFYAREATGLGQLARLHAVCEGLSRHWPGLAQLVVTGSPFPERLSRLSGVDWVKLPSVERVGPNTFAPRSLPLPIETVRRLREAVLIATVRAFQPHLIVVDSFPDDPEILPALQVGGQAGRRPGLVLALRDVVAEPELVRQTWAAAGVPALLDDLYDLILVYGDEDLYPAAREYGFSPAALAKTRYVGYLRRDAGTLPDTEQAALRRTTDRLVLVTAGGGRDGYALLQAALDAAAQPGGRPADWLLVTGPFMPEADRQKLADAARDVAAARVVATVEHMPAHVAAADAVVSMGGYNTLCEILSFERPAVIVPRVQPIREQLVRTELLHRRGLVEMIHPDELTPVRLRMAVDRLPRRAAGMQPRFAGSRAVAGALAGLLDTPA